MLFRTRFWLRTGRLAGPGRSFSSAGGCSGLRTMPPWGSSADGYRPRPWNRPYSSPSRRTPRWSDASSCGIRSQRSRTCRKRSVGLSSSARSWGVGIARSRWGSGVRRVPSASCCTGRGVGCGIVLRRLPRCSCDLARAVSVSGSLNIRSLRGAARSSRLRSQRSGVDQRCCPRGRLGPGPISATVIKCLVGL